MVHSDKPDRTHHKEGRNTDETNCMCIRNTVTYVNIRQYTSVYFNIRHSPTVCVLETHWLSRCFLSIRNALIDLFGRRDGENPEILIGPCGSNIHGLEEFTERRHILTPTVKSLLSHRFPGNHWRMAKPTLEVYVYTYVSLPKFHYRSFTVVTSLFFSNIPVDLYHRCI